MMTEEALYARLKEALRDAIARHHLDACSISLKSRGLTPEEAIGRTARTDYPILNGREVMLQARFGEALGQAFTSAPVDFEGSLADVLALDTAQDPQAGGMLVSTLNAVLRAVGEIGNTILTARAKIGAPEAGYFGQHDIAQYAIELQKRA